MFLNTVNKVESFSLGFEPLVNWLELFSVGMDTIVETITWREIT